MGKIYINTDAIWNLKSSVNSKANKCNDCANRLNIIRNNIDWKVSSRSGIDSRMNSLKNRVAHQSNLLYAYSRTLGNIANNMSDTDNRLKNDAKRLIYNLNRLTMISSVISQSSPRNHRIWEKDLKKYTFMLTLFGGKDLGPVLSSKPYISNTYKEYLKENVEHSPFDTLFVNKIKFSESVLHSSIGIEGSILGIAAAASAKGDLLGFDAKVKNAANWDMKKSKEEFESKGNITGHLAKGEPSTLCDNTELNKKGSFLTSTASGEAKVIWWSDGEFGPTFKLGVGASAVAATGEVGGKIGNKMFSRHSKAEGKLLHTEVKADAGVGVLRQNKSGTNVYGASVSAGAEACVAKGEVSGGVTLFGIKVDTSLEGKALSVEAKASAKYTNEGFSTGVGASLGLGAGVKVSVDWSEANWIKDIGESIGDVADFVKEQSKDFIGEISESFGSWGKRIASGAW